MLEPCAVKVARTVLRGGGGGNAVSLPDLLSDPLYSLWLMKEKERIYQ
jgi:hypothetical protein